MKSLRLTILQLLCLALVSVSLSGQSPSFTLRLEPLGRLQSYNTVMTSPEGTYSAVVTDLRYYISEITVIDDQGKETPLSDVYVLVDLANESQDYSLGSWEIDPARIRMLRFHIGVDAAHNHLDPTTYPPTHPLAPQDPTMHWGWTAGYRFCTFEGKAGVQGTTPSTPFEIHAVGDELYTQVEVQQYVTVEDGRAVFSIGADYANLFSGIEAQWGPIEHGNGPDAVRLMRNFAERVFAVPTSVHESSSGRAALSVVPNPVADVVTIRADDAIVERVELYGVDGADVRAHATINGEGSAAVTVSMQALQPGVYIVVATMGDEQVHVQRVVRLP